MYKRSRFPYTGSVSRILIGGSHGHRPELPEDQGKRIRSLWEEFDAMETADAKYAVCMDRLQPFLHNTLTDGHTWTESGTNRSEKMCTVNRFTVNLRTVAENRRIKRAVLARSMTILLLNAIYV